MSRADISVDKCEFRVPIDAKAYDEFSGKMKEKEETCKRMVK